MNIVFRPVEICPACGCRHSNPFVTRVDGIVLRRCDICATLFLDRIPLDISALYADNYFALNVDDAQNNAVSRIGYESSYATGHLDSEFYWAYRLADHISTLLQRQERSRRCLDVGAATGCLLNVFAAAGYETHGIEFSAPACEIASSLGHRMSQLAPGSLPEHASQFDVVTALEVIEHVEHLDKFFSGIYEVMANNGIFVGYFPSADDKAFSADPDYHWLQSSFEHLLYPSEAGIRALLQPLFGANVYVTTFFTRQSCDVIPNSIVVAIKGDSSLAAKTDIAELFRQLAYLNDRACFDIDACHGSGALSLAWDDAHNLQGPGAHTPYVAAVLCAKFGYLASAQQLLREEAELHTLGGVRLTDLLAIALHGGSIDWLRSKLPTISSCGALQLVVGDCAKVVDRFDATPPALIHSGDALFASEPSPINFTANNEGSNVAEK